MSVRYDAARVEALFVLSAFRSGFYRRRTARADALFDLTDALSCTDLPVRFLVDLVLAPEHRRHGAMYSPLEHGRIDIDRLRPALAATPMPRAGDGHLVLAVDVTCWLRPEAHTSSERIQCHTYGRGKGQATLVPGWPYSVVVALETGRSSWTGPLDAVRLGPGADAASVTAEQLRDVIDRLIGAGHWRPGDLGILVVVDAGYDAPRLAHLLGDLPAQCLTGHPARPADRPATLTSSSSATRAPGRTRPHDDDRDQALRPGDRAQLGPATPAADPPRRLAHVGRTAHHRWNPDPAVGRTAAQRRLPGRRPAWQDHQRACPSPARHDHALIDGLAVQVTVHDRVISRRQLADWVRIAASNELGVDAGSLA